MDYASFWDMVHANSRSEFLGPGTSESLLPVLDLAGPFRDDLRVAQSVLDIGPGYGGLILSLPRAVRKTAIEVSKVNRERLQARGVECYEPGEVGGSSVDLAWTVSCLQHCEPEMVRLLMRDAAKAVRVGGIFYVEAIVAANQTEEGPREEFVVPREELDWLAKTNPALADQALRSGAFSLRPKELLLIAREVGFEPTGEFAFMPQVGAVRGYVVRLMRV